jgi:hypothetical protein
MKGMWLAEGKVYSHTLKREFWKPARIIRFFCHTKQIALKKIIDPLAQK